MGASECTPKGPRSCEIHCPLTRRCSNGNSDEDAGFAINGGKGWKEVAFTNHKIELLGTAAVAMGTYVFTCATSGDNVRVEYTFGYRRNDDGKARIFLHHSSVPYATPAPKSGAAAGSTTTTTTSTTEEGGTTTTVTTTTTSA